MLFWPSFGYFQCSLEIQVTVCSNHNNKNKNIKQNLENTGITKKSKTIIIPNLIFFFHLFFISFSSSPIYFIIFVLQKKKYIHILSQFFHLLRLVFDQSSPVQPVSESRGWYHERYRGAAAGRTDGQKYLCPKLDNIKSSN